jgi:hypothetical protein
MGLCTTRTSSRLKRHRHKGSCWRNPFLVFILTFLTIGSLRFRVPARSKLAATNLLKRKREERIILRAIQKNKLSINDKKRVRATVSGVVGIGRVSDALKYVLIEETKGIGGSRSPSCQKYRAFMSREEDSENEGAAITVAQWASIVATAPENDSSILLLNEIISSSPYKALFFETPSIDASSYETQIFEFVIVDAPVLHEMSISGSSNNKDESYINPFHVPISTATNSSSFVATFPNLGGDATLVVPKMIEVSVTAAGISTAASSTVYAHLANFIRNGTSEQITAVWNMVAQAYRDRIIKQPQESVWLSTSGLGVLWLHFRLDNVPKYYSYEPYKQVQK